MSDGGPTSVSSDDGRVLTWPPPSEPGSAWRSAARVAGGYALVSLIWFVASERILSTVASDAAQLNRLQLWNEGIFVVGTAVALFLLVRSVVRRSWASEVRFHSVLEQSLVGVYLVRRGTFQYVNPTLAAIFGYGTEEVMGRPVVELVAPAERERVRENLRRREEGEVSSMRYEFRGLHAEDRELTLEVFGRRVQLADGPAILGVLVDRTEARKLEEQMHRAQRMDAVGQLTGAVAHDFNNLLTAIIAPLELIMAQAEGAGAEDELHAELRQIRATALSAAALTRKLLAFSRKQVDNPELVDLSRAVERMEPLLQRLLPARLRLDLRMDELDGTVRVDPSALEQVVLNLVVNASDAMDGRGVVVVSTRAVTVSPDRPSPLGPSGERVLPGDYLCLEVSDTGRGIGPEAAERIFEPFFTTKDGGTGLGLATVFGQTKKAGGEILVDSRPGEGSTFTVLLPRVREAPTASARAERERVWSGAAGRRILVVEDEEPVGRAVAEALRRFGFEAFLATDLDGATAVARERPGLDLVLTDLSLADGTGPDVVRAVAALQEDVRVLYMSGYSDGEILDRRDRTGDGGARILEKPFSLDTLRGAVEEALAEAPWRRRSRGA